MKSDNLSDANKLTLQITPSQSKINTSTSGNKSFPGSDNFATFAFNAELISRCDAGNAVLLIFGEKALAARDVDASVNAVIAFV